MCFLHYLCRSIIILYVCLNICDSDLIAKDICTYLACIGSNGVVKMCFVVLCRQLIPVIRRTFYTTEDTSNINSLFFFHFHLVFKWSPAHLTLRCLLWH
jgi:hypothetical protein